MHNFHFYARTLSQNIYYIYYRSLGLNNFPVFGPGREEVGYRECWPPETHGNEFGDRWEPLRNERFHLEKQTEACLLLNNLPTNECESHPD